MRACLTSLVLLLACLVGTQAVAATQAGTTVTNSVLVDWQQAGVAQPSIAASASFQVAQLVKAALTWQDSAPVLVPASTSGSLTFRLTNSGNGTDSFSFTTSLPATPAPNFVPANCKLYLDTDASATFTTADVVYAPGMNDPSLSAGAHLDIFVNCAVPANTPDASLAQLDIDAASTTLTGVNQSQCESGACMSTTDPTIGLWAVTDASGGKAQAQGEFQSASPGFNFPLTQSVSDGSGGQNVVSGSVVTYTLEVEPIGTTIAYDTQVTDPIPANTSYVPNSITLDGVALTDAADADLGYFNAASNQIEVQLGQREPTDPTQIITFKVTIN